MIDLKNSGKLPIDALLIELIGIEPLTHPLGQEGMIIRPLPSTKVKIPLDTMILPNGLARIDLRIPVLMYLKNLNEMIADTTLIHRTSINIVLSPRAKGENVPTTLPSGLYIKDRVHLVVDYAPSLIEHELVASLLEKGVIEHRIQTPF